MRREGAFLEVIEDDVIWCIVGLTDFLKDDTTLTLDFSIQKRAVCKNVPDNVYTKRQILLEELDVIRGGFPRSVSIDMTTDILDLFGNTGCGPSFCAFEGHMLEKVGDAVVFGSFVACADRNIGAEGYGLNAFHAFRDDGQTVVERGDFNRIGHEFP